MLGKKYQIPQALLFNITYRPFRPNVPLKSCVAKMHLLIA